MADTATGGTTGAQSIDIKALDTPIAYKLLVGAAQPRPIAWVSTTSPDGVANLAPFSFFTVASREPATMMISVTRRVDGDPKHTLVNAEQTGVLTINIPARDHLDAVQISSQEVPGEVDEHELAGLATLPCEDIDAPRIAGVGISMECVLDRTIDVGTDVMLLARVLRVHAAPGVVDARYRVDNSLLQPLARLAGPWFSTVETEIPAPVVETPVHKPAGAR
ncbi:flavin reductase family protein [Nesterenkonia populi]|uniref:flavin reductase family protein n=1 Tax=Nesterenkonia populi TaxID=1591087 RepID=UPI001478CA8E|nr:flavin reductase family protein [Nesterenkonia populi]